MKRQTLIEDAERMEQAAIDLTFDHKAKPERILYWLCVAVLHLIEWTVKHDGK